MEFTLTRSFGFSVLDHSNQSDSDFWATIHGHHNVPMTLRADRMDLEDFASTLDKANEYTSVVKFLKAMSDECWDHFVYLFLDHLMTHERQKGDEYRLRLAIMGRMYDIIKIDAGELWGDMYTQRDFKLASHSLDIFARKVTVKENYICDDGTKYRIWIESQSIRNIDDLIKVYSDVVINYAIRSCKN